MTAARFRGYVIIIATCLAVSTPLQAVLMLAGWSVMARQVPAMPVTVWMSYRVSRWVWEPETHQITRE